MITKKELIKMIKKLRTNCSYCGTLMHRDYEGTLSCPSYKAYVSNNNHQFMSGNSEELAKRELLMKIGNIKESDLK